MPRIRNWKGLKFSRPDKHTHYKHIDHLFKDVIDWSFNQDGENITFNAS